MLQIDIDKMIHDEGNCDSHSCQYCEEDEDNHLHGTGCKCRDCLEEEADFRCHEKIDKEGGK